MSRSEFKLSVSAPTCGFPVDSLLILPQFKCFGFISLFFADVGKVCIFVTLVLKHFRLVWKKLTVNLLFLQLRNILVHADQNNMYFQKICFSNNLFFKKIEKSVCFI